jgi:hypothetical protein
MDLTPRDKPDGKTAKTLGNLRGTWAKLMNWIAKGHRKNPVCKG